MLNTDGTLLLQKPVTLRIESPHNIHYNGIHSGMYNYYFYMFISNEIYWFLSSMDSQWIHNVFLWNIRTFYAEIIILFIRPASQGSHGLY